MVAAMLHGTTTTTISAAVAAGTAHVMSWYSTMVKVKVCYLIWYLYD